MQKRIGNVFATSDLFEATFLSFKGFKFKINRDNPRSTLFIFNDDEKHMLVESLLREFWSGSDEEALLSEFKNVKKKAIINNYKKNYYERNRQNESKQPNEGERQHMRGQGEAGSEDENRGKGETTS